MGGTPNVMGMVNDSDFQTLSPSDKRSALSKLTGDKAFAGLSDAETMQFVSRLAKPQTTPAPPIQAQQPEQPQSYLRYAMTAPKMGLESGLPSPAQVPTNVGPMQAGATIGGLAGGAISGGVVPIAKSLIGGVAGAGIGGYGGKEIGSIFGEPQLGEKIGAGVGSVAGTVMGARGVIPSRYGFLKTLFSDPEVSETAKLNAAKQALADNPELAENSQDLISRMKKLVIPGEQPTSADLKRAGDLTQTPLEKLKALAKFGDKLAQNELNRRLRQ